MNLTELLSSMCGFSLGLLTWDGVITAFVPIVVFAFTIYFQNRKHRREKRRTKEVLRNVLALNIRRFLDGIEWQKGYIDRCISKISITVSPIIITEEPLNRSNEIIEALTYNKIYETLEFDKSEEMAQKLTKVWESLTLYKLSLASVNAKLSDYVNFYQKERGLLTNEMNAFRQSFNVFFSSLSQEDQNFIIQSQRNYPLEGTQNLDIILITFLIPTKEALREISNRNQGAFTFIEKLDNIIHIYDQLNLYVDKTKEFLENHRIRNMQSFIFVGDFAESFENTNK